MPSQHYDDFTLSSTGEKSDLESRQHAFHGEQQPHPLKSTLPSQYKRSNQANNGLDRPSLPRIWSHQEDNGPHHLQREFARNSGGEDDITLSTDLGTVADEFLDARINPKRATTIYEDDSFIPGVGRGHQRFGGNGASSYSAHRDLLASSNLPIHPSPGTAARHDRLRLSVNRPQGQQTRQNQSPLASPTASEGEDSESGNETSSTSTTSFIMHPQGLMQSKAESTGNHNAFTVTQQSQQSPMPNRNDRPKLDARALDEMDKALKKGRAMLRQDLPDSPSPGPSRRGTPRGKGALRSRKEERLAYERGSPARHSQRREGAEGGSISSGNDARKPSDSSSNGRKQPGTTGSTSGETLVDDGKRDFLYSTTRALHTGQRSLFMKLPSGQRMGKGLLPESAVYLPDITGMTSALESPAKAILGVEHRQIPAEAIQARHIQTSETRLQEFDDLAYYVKSVEQNLDQTQKKIRQVEETSFKCAKEVDALRSEWSYWRSAKGKWPTRQADITEELVEDFDDDYEGKIKAMNDHIAHLNHDLHKYRSTMEQMLMDKAEKEKARIKKVQEKQQRQNEKRKFVASHHMPTAPLSSSPIKPSRVDEDNDDDEEATRLEMVLLRKQVNKVAKEVERLREIVDGEGRDERAPTKSARFASTMPIPTRRDIGVGSQSPFVKARTVGRRSSSLERGNSEARHSSDLDDLRGRNSSPPPSVRGFDEGVLSDDDPGDETVRPENEIQIEQEEDVSVIAQSRAQKTFEVIEENKGASHDERTCTVCISKQKREKRREARKDRVYQQARASSFDNLEEDGDDQVFSSLLEAAAAKQDPSMALPIISKHYATIQRLLKEHMDEFYHHRLLYCELADELKHFTPEMTRVKRQILAEHVMEAVEGLEYRARRINLLQDLMGHSAANEEQDHESRRGKERRRKPRNSPPIVDGGDLYRRVASA